jgi:hypothetical protein
MPRAPFLATVALVLAGAAILAACSGADDANDPVAVFDPQAFRPQIEAVEAILYKETPLDYAEAERAGWTLMQLQRAMEPHAKTFPQRQAVQDLIFLAANADALGEGGYAIPDLSLTRRNWERYRADVFGSADWFHQDAPRVADAQKRKPPTVDRGQVYELVRVIERLEDLIPEGERRCEDLGEPDYEPGYEGFAGRAQIDGWNRFYREWEERLTDIARRLPPQPAWDGHMEYVMAYQEVGTAMNELRFVTMGAGDWATPFLYQWESRFTAARSQLAQARARLTAFEPAQE